MAWEVGSNPTGRAATGPGPKGAGGAWRDLEFRDLPRLLRPADLLVFNDTRVVPARVHGTKESGGKIELLLERSDLFREVWPEHNVEHLGSEPYHYYHPEVGQLTTQHILLRPAGWPFDARLA